MFVLKGFERGVVGLTSYVKGVDDGIHVLNRMSLANSRNSSGVQALMP